MAGYGPFHGAQPWFAARLQAMINAAKAEGRHIGIGNAYRDVNQQIQLRKKNGCPDIWSSPASSCRVPTAIPGRSMHNKGLAADITGDKAWANANAHRFGLHFNVSGEDWHVEPIGDAEAHEQAKFQGGEFGDSPIRFDMQWQEEKRNPEDELAQRLFSMGSILSGGAVEAGEPAEMNEQVPGMNVDVTTIGADEEMMRQKVHTLMSGGEAGSGMWEGPGSGGNAAGGAPPPGYVPPGKGADRWRNVFLQALAYTGQDPKWVDLGLRRLNQESGGNPYAVNNWDSNARAGNATRGLMQHIPSAWNERAKELAGRGINDGFANIVASIRYTLNRYGSLAAWGRRGGY